MGDLQVIRTEAGEELVVLPRAEYDRLAARAGDAVAEDRLTARLVDESTWRLDAGNDVALPEAIWREIEAGTPVVLVLRRFRCLSRIGLSQLSGLSEETLVEIEAGRPPAAAERVALATALSVPIDLFED